MKLPTSIFPVHELQRLRRGVALGLLAGCLLAHPASAFDGDGPPPGWGGPPGPPGPPIERMFDRLSGELGLDDETRARVEALAAADRAWQEERRVELARLKEGMRTLLDQDEPDEDAVMKQAEAIGALETEVQKQRLRTLLAVRAALTPEQRARLASIHSERRERHRRAVAESCAEELAAYCPNAEAGRERMRCLFRHRRELSDTCREAARPPHGRGSRRGEGDRPQP
ncbi:MAG: Spy/CpxP family protein refolding chaperone [Myxococcota bacterium]